VGEGGTADPLSASPTLIGGTIVASLGDPREAFVKPAVKSVLTKRPTPEAPVPQ